MQSASTITVLLAVVLSTASSFPVSSSYHPVNDNSASKDVQLFNAILEGKNADIAKLTKEGADPTYLAMGPLQKVWGCLTLASYVFETVDTVMALIRTGAQVNERDSENYTPLLVAAQLNHYWVASVC